VAERIVHDLEFIQVDEKHPERAAVSLRLHDGLPETVGEERAVGKPGERVELREVGELRLAVEAL